MSSSKLGTLIVIVAFAGGLQAANLTGPNIELDLDKGLSNNLVAMPNGNWALKIDDMLIPIDPSKNTKSGSCCTLWTDGVVYYQFHSNIADLDGRPLSGDPAGRRAAFESAAAAWENAVPGLTFIEGTGSGYYIMVQSDSGNSSWLGMLPSYYQPQEMWLFNWDYIYIIAHEIGHALGLIHEQSRTDRGTYVTINYNNIEDDREDNYDIFSGSIAHGDYDYESVMHYGRCSFWDPAAGTCGIHGYTMDATSGGAAAVGMTVTQANNAMGNRSSLTSGDIAGVRSMYPGGGLFEDGFESGNTSAWSASVP